MALEPRRRGDAERQAVGVPIPLFCLIALLLAGGILGLASGWGRSAASPQPSIPLDAVARRAGCHVSEFDGGAKHNPPVSGRFVERDRAKDGSYAGRRPPSLSAGIHALYHGRVLIQYRPGLAARALEELDRLVTAHSDRVLLFENQTGMQAPVAATSYLSLMTCRRVDARTLHALRVYRDRRRGFGQAF